MGGKSSGFGDASYISTVFDWSFYLTVVIVVVTYVLAIVWHSYKKRGKRLHAFRRRLGTVDFAIATASKSESETPNWQRLWAFLCSRDYAQELELNT